MIMLKTVEYTNNIVSPATIELLRRERSKGNSLRQLGQMFGRSHEGIRQLLAKEQWPESLLSESRVAAKLGYPVGWLVQLRKEGLIKPVKHFGWRYSEEQVRQIPSLITETRRCERCGKPRPLHSHKFCAECSQYRQEHSYEFLSPEAKAKKNLIRRKAWAKAKSKGRRALPGEIRVLQDVLTFSA